VIKRQIEINCGEFNERMGEDVFLDLQRNWVMKFLVYFQKY